MTLPASGAISFSNIQTETGDTGDISMSWISDNTKLAQRSNLLSGYYNKAWYQRNADGNCNNGNCNCASNCGNINCVNCYSSQCINCANCDARAWLQSNCNCACTYNCNAAAVSYNCNCACACDCGGCCFLIGSPVVMADGTTKKIEDVRVGDYVLGAKGEANPVLALNRPKLGIRSMVSVNGVHETTVDHSHVRGNFLFGVFSLKDYYEVDDGVPQEVIVDDAGHTEWWICPGVPEGDKELLTELVLGDELHTTEGPKAIETVIKLDLPEETQVYNLCVGGSHTYSVSGYFVSGFMNGYDFDYRSWTQKGKPYNNEDYFLSVQKPKTTTKP